MSNNIAVSILAAGQGKRILSQTPKPFHHIAGLPMIAHLVKALDKINPNIICIVSQKRYSPHLKDALNHISINCQIIEAFQETPKGTGDATKIAWQTLSKIQHKPFTDILITPADVPLIETNTIQNFIHFHKQNKHPISIMGFCPRSNKGYGRILLENDRISAIVEEKDCSENQKNIPICNSGIIIINTKILSELLPNLNNNNSQKEFYITDIISIAVEKGLSSAMYLCKDADQLYGINSRSQLAEAENIWQTRKKLQIMDETGTNLIMPETIRLYHDTKIDEDATIGPYVVFGRDVHVGRMATISAFSYIEGATLKPHSQVGPFAKIRANTIVHSHAKIGSFVEVKNSSLSEKSKAAHLAYIGDTDIKEGVNIGAGVVIANYDGSKKHKTLIKKLSFVGSNSTLVAPLTLGEASTVAAGSVITRDISKSQIAFARSKQINKDRKK